MKIKNAELMVDNVSFGVAVRKIIFIKLINFPQENFRLILHS